jgi:FixJ family two-component response regulator
VSGVPIADLSLVEERIVRLVLAGRSTTQIAADFGAEPRFVEWHLTRAVRKLVKTTALHRRLRRALLGQAAVGGPGDTAQADGREAP